MRLVDKLLDHHGGLNELREADSLDLLAAVAGDALGLRSPRYDGIIRREHDNSLRKMGRNL